MKRALPFAAGMLVAIASEAAPAIPQPGPATANYARGNREADDAKCRACHSRAAEEHEGSLHAHAWNDASFQRGYLAEPAAFCRGCHAPEAQPKDLPDAFAREQGVACVTCHQPKGSNGVITGERAAGTRAPHPVTRVADFGTRACISCHEFSFPGADALGERGLMQRTASEHAGSPSNGTSCAGCHLGTGHRFAASRAPELLAAALDASARRLPDGTALFALRSRGVGHAFPTGDLFRRLVLRVKTGHGTIERRFERTFRAAGVRFEHTDTRLPPDRAIEVRLPVPRTSFAWEIAYQRVTANLQIPPFSSEVESETLLAHGTL